MTTKNVTKQGNVWKLEEKYLKNKAKGKKRTKTAEALTNEEVSILYEIYEVLALSE